jgi:hypothetical protein
LYSTDVPCARTKKRRVDQVDVNAAMRHRLDGVGDLDQLAGGPLRFAARPLITEFHSAPFQLAFAGAHNELDVGGLKLSPALDLGLV